MKADETCAVVTLFAISGKQQDQRVSLLGEVIAERSGGNCIKDPQRKELCHHQGQDQRRSVRGGADVPKPFKSNRRERHDDRKRPIKVPIRVQSANKLAHQNQHEKGEQVHVGDQVIAK